MISSKQAGLLLLASALCFGAAAQQSAASTTAIDSLKTSELEPVEVRAVRASDLAPFSKTNISAKAIEQVNLGQDLPYILQYTPSTVVTSDAGAGVGYTGLRIRGTDGTRINVTLNGVPVNDAESSATFFVNLPDLASSTSSIQLQRGVGTSTNGAASFGATLSISTLDGLDKAGGEVSAAYGSFNTQKYTIKAGTGRTASGLSLDVRMSQISSDGFVDRAASMLRAAQIVTGWKSKDENTSMHLMVMAGGEKTGQAWNGVTQDSLKTNPTFNELGRKADGTFYDNQTDNYRQNYYQLFADHKFNSRLTAHVGLYLTRGIGYYEEYRLDEKFSSYGRPNFTTAAGDTFKTTDLIRSLYLDNFNYGSVFSLLYNTRSGTKITLGGGWSRFKNKHYGEVNWADYGIPNNYRWYNLDAQKSDFNIYAKAEHTLKEKLVLYGDLQYRSLAYTANGFRKNPTVVAVVNYDFFNPKAGLSYLIKQGGGERQKLYASVAVANKEPNRDDFEASPNDQPRAEQLVDFEGGYEIAKRNWTASANLYYMKYKDQLVLTGRINDVGAYVRTNIPESYRAGIELQGGWKVNKWLQLSGNITLSRNKIANYTEYVDTGMNYEQTAITYSSANLSFSPEIIAAASATVTPFPGSEYGKGLQLELTGKHVGKQYLDNTGSPDRQLADYTLADLRIRYAIAVKPFRELAITLSQNNLLNRSYASNGYTWYSYILEGQRYTTNNYYPQAGYNWLLGVTVKW